MKSKRSWVRKVIYFAVIFAVLIGGYVMCQRQAAKKNQPHYNEIPVKRGDLSVFVLVTGTVAPENKVDIKPAFAGRIEEVKKEEGDRVKKGDVLALMSTLERAALVDAAEATDAAQAKKWEQVYLPVPIFSPINGTIIKRNVQPGQSFTTQDSIMTLSDRLIVKAQVDETDIAHVALNQEVTVTLDAYPDIELKGRAIHIDYDATTVDNVTNYIVYVLPTTTPDTMRSGMTANVRFNAGNKKGVLLIPTSAVKYDDKQAYVLLKGATQSDGTYDVIEQELDLGATDGKQIEVTLGLKEGDVILTEQFKLKEASGGSPFTIRGKEQNKRRPAAHD